MKIDASELMLKGNVFMTKGKIGERIVQRIGEIESEKERVKDARGCQYIQLFVRQYSGIKHY